MKDIIGFILLIGLVVLAAKKKTGVSWGAVFTTLKILAIVGIFFLIASFLGLS